MIKINALVSNNQIVVRSIPTNLEFEKWGDQNVDFGMVWRPNYIVLDPLVDGSFGTYFLIDAGNEVKEDSNAQRSALIPFEVEDALNTCISTVAERICLYKDLGINLEDEKKRGRFYPLNNYEEFTLEPGRYSLHFQVCIGRSVDFDSLEDEVYYRFNFIRDEDAKFKVLLEDDYGWDTNTGLLKDRV